MITIPRLNMGDNRYHDVVMKKVTIGNQTGYVSENEAKQIKKKNPDAIVDSHDYVIKDGKVIPLHRFNGDMVYVGITIVLFIIVILIYIGVKK